MLLANIRSLDVNRINLVPRGPVRQSQWLSSGGNFPPRKQSEICRGLSLVLERMTIMYLCLHSMLESKQRVIGRCWCMARPRNADQIRSNSRRLRAESRTHSGPRGTHRGRGDKKFAEVNDGNNEVDYHRSVGIHRSRLGI